ncbi:metal ABC transporter permease [Leucobacter rhizosphaerae]|uniref:Metal ABC transporter permease n=1 Tax=Leucobacter rhizosphaerae TaxID=2932245 RepID=A0ABY4FSK3_9MICO|nr:metal ABC transporter permease [Leucobacter rhizosphaerae]UOQ59260.1 metal ABC transporter permease [Leucobacter rhizosphaerae]
MSYFALAITEIVLLGLLSGVAGTLIVFRRRSFFAVALSHATFPGGVAFAIVGWNLLLGQALFAIVLVLLMTLLGRIPGQGRQVTSGVVLSFGFALGTLLASLNPGLGVPVEALLVGSPLGVNTGDVAATGGVLLVSLALVALTGRRILFHTFDPVGFRAAGFRAWPVELVVTGIIAASIVVAMPAVGAILGVAILIGPAATARLIAPRLAWVPPISAAIGVGSGVLGLWISREFGVAAGGSIGLVVAGVFVVVLAGRSLVGRRGTGTSGAPRSGNFATVGGTRSTREVRDAATQA